jgi:hypothetical protein
MLLVIGGVLLDVTWNSNELLNEMANAMYAKFQKYWGNPNIVLLIAAVLDPSMKTEFVKFYFYTVGENVDVKMRELKRYLKKYYLEYEEIMRSHSLPMFIPPEDHIRSESFTSSPLFGKRRVEHAFAQFASQNADARPEQTEMDTYMEDPRILVKTDENFNVLGSWKKK